MAKRSGGKRKRSVSKNRTAHPFGISWMDERRPCEYTPFSSIVPRMFAKFGIGRRLGIERFQKAWEEIRIDFLHPLFPDIKLDKKIRLSSFRGGTVSFEIKNHALYQELNFYKKEILSRFQQKIPEENIKEIKFRGF
ncbi:MAG: DUF721 domain-containing protein [Planctomycetia bacterium]|nr:DUF721 domain-containing protein [Planctomycetia bacterium]